MNLIPLVYSGLSICLSVGLSAVGAWAAEPVIPRMEATGKFHTQRIDGKWWFFDRQGKAMFLTGVNGGWPFNMANSSDGRSHYREAVERRFPATQGGNEAWQAWQGKRVQSWGFNWMGGQFAPVDGMLAADLGWELNFYFNGGKHPDGTPYRYTDMLYPGVSWHGVRNVFSPDYELQMAKDAEYLTRLKDSPGFFGAYIDNERNFDGLTEVPLGCWRLPSDNPAKQAVMTAAKQVFGDDLDAFNAAWKRHYASWDEVAADTDAPLEARHPQAKRMCEVILEMAAERFFGVLATEIKKRAPDALILGCRQHQHDMPDIFWKVMGKWCDVISLNNYLPCDVTKGVPAPAIAHWDRIAALTNRPLLISEWGVSAHENGYNGSYNNQQERAIAYQKIAETIASSPHLIGFQYFKLMDDESAARDECFNWGLVDVEDEPHQEMVEMTKRVNPSLLRIHAEGKQRHLYQPEPALTTTWTVTPPTTPTADHSAPLHNGPLALRQDGDRFVASLNGIDLGCGFSPVIGQQVPAGRSVWPSKLIVDLDTEDARFRVLTCSWTWDPTTTAAPESLMNQTEGEWRQDPNDHKGPTKLRTTWRLWIPKDGLGWIATEPVSITNTGSFPWKLTNLTHRWNPLVGGFAPVHGQTGFARTETDIGLRMVIPVSTISVGGAIWLDGGNGLHPDICHDLARSGIANVLEPGETYRIPSSPIGHFLYAPRAEDTTIDARLAAIAKVMLTYCTQSKSGKMLLDLNDAAKGK